MGENELEFYKNLVIMFLKSVRVCASGEGNHRPPFTPLDQNLQLVLSSHPLLLIDSGDNPQMYKQWIIGNKDRAQTMWEVDKFV